MKKVNVLLSAYNGEKYIKEQIDSILAQSWENIDIYVRDDGSSDGTAAILKEYESAGKIKLELGKNVGFIKSFFWLVVNSGDADYYAYSDQDDSWNSDKIKMAVEKLEEEVSSEDMCKLPVLYFSNYDFYDDDMNEKEITKRFPKGLADTFELLNKRGKVEKNMTLDVDVYKVTSDGKTMMELRDTVIEAVQSGKIIDFNVKM